MYLFYTPEAIHGDFYLEEEESKHCVRVLRLKAGDRIHVTNGKGSIFECQIISINEKRCMVAAISINDENPKVNPLHIAIAPTKNIDRFEWFLEKSTEIGLQEVTPIICTRSERQTIKTERMHKVLIAAMKQSLKATLPALNPLTDFKKFLEIPITGQKFIAFIDENVKMELNDHFDETLPTTILIGPEGDFTPLEIELAKKFGFAPISLGNSRLRTETAGVVACTIVNFLTRNR